MNRWYLCLAISFLSVVSFGQWTEIQLPASAGGMDFTSDQQGFFTGYGGALYRTDNAGQTWDTSYIDQHYSWLSSAYFFDDQTGFLGGGANFPFPPNSISELILRTDDGGQTFDSLYGSFTGDVIIDIEFGSDQVGYFIPMWSGSPMHMTKDGGQTITRLFADTSDHVWNPNRLSVSAPSTNVVYLLKYELGAMFGQGPYSTIYKSSDTGNTWMDVFRDTVDHNTRYNDVFFTSDDVGMAVGGEGKYAYTVDGGANWTESIIRDSLLLSQVYMVSPDTIYVLGWQLGSGPHGVLKFFFSNNAGGSWNEELIDTTNLQATMAITPGRIYAQGGDKLYYRDRSDLPNSIFDKMKIINLVISPNPYSHGDLKIVGEDAQLIKAAEIMDLTGRWIKTVGVEEARFSIDDIPAGKYLVNFRSDQGQTVGVARLIVGSSE